MASLRKKPADVAVETATNPNPVAVNPETSPPSPAPELDAAGEALRSQLEALKQAETTHQQAQIAMLAAQERRNAWVESNPLAKQNLSALNVLHRAAVEAGLADTSPEYFNFMEEQLAALQRPATATHLAEEMQQRAAQARAPEPPPPAPRSNGSFVSAPVSREVPNANGKRRNGTVTLTRAEQEAARVAGIDFETYAREKLRYETMKANGEYGVGEPR